jgi:hypothetical protein
MGCGILFPRDYVCQYDRYVSTEQTTVYDSLVSGQLHSLATQPVGEETLLPNEKEVGWPIEQIWTFWRKRTCSPNKQLCTG